MVESTPKLLMPSRPSPPQIDIDNRSAAPNTEPEKKKADESAANDEQPQAGADKKAPDEKTTPFYRRPLLMAVLITVVLLLIIGGILYWLYARQYEWTDDAFIDGHSVRLAPKISGYVTRLNITDNQQVHAGDRLLEIDPRDNEVALAAAKDAEASVIGEVAQAEARLKAMVAQQAEAEADVKAAEATAHNADQDKERYAKLAPRAASQETLDASVARARSTKAQLEAAIARSSAAVQQVNLAKSQITTSLAQAQQARVQVQQAELNLSYTRIDAPITGYVTRRTVELGDYVQTGTALFALVDPHVWVTANYKETQLTRMQVGQPVEIRIDSYPDHRLKGHVDSFQRGSGARFSVLPAENATGNYVKVVQRIPVKIVIDDPVPESMALGLGMSVMPTVKVRGNSPSPPNPPTKSR